MCIVFWFIAPESERDKPNKIRFLMLFNREEQYQRPTETLKLYKKDNDLIACGLDLLAGGTWLALNLKTGLIAFLTNRNAVNRIGIYKKFLGYFLLICDRLALGLFSVKSRGTLITDLISSQTQKEFFLDQKMNNDQQQVQYEMCEENGIKQITCQLPQFQHSKEYLDALAIKTLLNKDQYRGFNLFFGSLQDLDFRMVGINSQEIIKAQDGYGSFSSYQDLQDKRLNKQEYGVVKMKESVERFNDHQDIQKLIDDVFSFAKEEYPSSENFFVNEEQGNLFIRQNKPYKNFGLISFLKPSLKNISQGTRTSTVVLLINDKLQVFEKTYI